MTLVFVLFAGFELFSPWSVLFILRCTASSILSENFVTLITVEFFQSLMDVFRVSRCSTCPRTIFVCWSSLGSVTGTAIMCPRGRLGVKPGTAYGAFDRWRQSVLEASPPGGVLWAVVMGKSDSHSFTFPWQGHLSPPICWGGEYLLLCLKWFLTSRPPSPTPHAHVTGQGGHVGMSACRPPPACARRSRCPRHWPGMVCSLCPPPRPRDWPGWGRGRAARPRCRYSPRSPPAAECRKSTRVTTNSSSNSTMYVCLIPILPQNMKYYMIGHSIRVQRLLLDTIDNT